MSQRFDYEVKAVVRVDAALISYLMECSGRHYDGKCQDAGAQGGFLYGWNNVVKFDLEMGKPFTEITMSSRELDTMAKITEIHSNTPNLSVFLEIRKIFLAINEEIVNLRELGTPQWNKEPFSLAGLFEEKTP